MLKKKSLFLVLVVLFLLSVSGCASKSNVGVLDYEKVFKESKDYVEITNIKTEIDKLEEQLLDKKVAAQEELKVKEAELNEEMQSKMQARMQEKENEVNQRIQDKNKSIFDDKNKQLQDFSASLEEEANKELAVLRQEAEQPGVTEERFAEMDKQAADIIKKGQDKMAAKQSEIQAEIDALLAEDRQVAESELMAYSETVMAELREESNKKANEYMAGLFGEDQQKQNELKEKHAQLVKKFDEKLKLVVSEVAKGKKLETVFVNYVVNVKAVDISDDVIKAMNEDK